jgi:hypothetical protein
LLLDYGRRRGFDSPRNEMEGRSLFISSCTRRDLARRRPQPVRLYLPHALGALLLAAAVAVLLVLVGAL